MTIHLCGPKIFLYDGLTFEFGYCGPHRLTKGGDTYKRHGRRFYQRIGPFMKMNEREQAEFRIGGGCLCLKDGAMMESRDENPNIVIVKGKEFTSSFCGLSDDELINPLNEGRQFQINHIYDMFKKLFY